MKAFLELLKAWGPWGVFVLSIVESVGIPNPGGTDFLLLFLVATNPAIAWPCAVLATAGSLIGSFLFYRIVRKGGEIFLDKRTAPGFGAQFRQWFVRYGMVTVFVSALLPFPFMPLKVFALCAAATGVPLGRFLWVMAAARIPRYFGLAYLARELGMNSSAWLKSHLWHMGIAAAVLFVLLYLLIDFAGKQPATATVAE